MKLLKCSYEAGKKIYFNDSSDYEDSKESDSDDETENETCENVTGENEIRPECVMDAANPGSYVALNLSPDLFEMYFCAILLMLELLLCCYSFKVFSPDFHII